MRAFSLLGVSGIALALAFACRPSNGGGGDDGGTGCDAHDDCDDGIDCTDDLCTVDRVCEHRPQDALCGDGLACDPEAGCVEPGCTTDEECDDGVACTLDYCGVGGCENRPHNELCEAGETCVSDEGCQVVGCSSDEACDDGLDCTTDHCTVDATCGYITHDELCAEGEHCVSGLGCIVGECAADADCDDGDFCNGEETCEPEFGCVPAEEPRDCNDNDECTIDSCDPGTDMCAYAIDTSVPGCDEFDPETHLNGCFAIDPPISQRCAWGHVNYDFNQVCFDLVGPVLTVTAGSFPLSQTPAPTDASFSVEHVISGGCTETYTLTGTFTGSSTFSGTWTSRFTDVDGFSCSVSGCANLTVPLTGTRI